jgi:ABC-type nitrate/sulfonate/bicarbonate transport system permease component
MARPARWVLGLTGVLLFGAAWELLGRSGLLGPSWPPLTRVALALVSPAYRELFGRALSATLSEAFTGYLVGVLAALVSASVTVVVPRTRGGIYRVALVLNSVPVIALGPLFNAVLPRWMGPVAVATLSVYFAMFVAVLAGLDAASRAHHDVLTVLGSSPWRRFWHLQAPSALPGIADGLKLSAPAAILGAIIGEWFGAERGLGPLLVSSMQNYRIDLLWSAAVLGALAAMAAYGALSVVERRVASTFR